MSRQCYIGMEINRNRKMKTICINQQRYISRMLCRFKMKNCRSIKLPMNSSVKLSELKNEEKVIEKRFLYREAVGSLNYVALVSRPDISYFVNTLARFSNNPSELHWKAVKHVMRYLKDTNKFSLCYNGKAENGLIGYCDWIPTMLVI